MNVVILGGSAFSTPVLFRYLNSQPGVDGLSVTLLGRSPKRIESVQRAARLLSDSSLVSISASALSAQALSKALPSADLVLIQVRPGGHSARAMDEVFPHKYRLCGDEGLGVSGLRAAWRIWPIVKSLLGSVLEFCPDALVVMMTAPLSLMVRMAKRSFPALNVIGICELPWVTFKEITRKVGSVAHEADFDYLGVNHLGWFYRMRSGSLDLVTRFASRQNGDSFPGKALVCSCKAVPTPYLRMHYETEEVLQEQRTMSKPRGTLLEEIGDKIINTYASGTREEIIASLELRPAPWYAEAVGPLIVARCTGEKSIPLFLCDRNNGYDPSFRDDDILEIPHCCQEDMFIRQNPKTKAGVHLQRTLLAFIEFERIAAEAICQQDSHLLAHAVIAHPWVHESAMIPAIVHEITENNVAA